eukprot:m.27784 g.27784  ORF g.27784 m.27784 type:complete len:338 (+) comp11777_c0_seq21:318-1331(+)
MPFESFISQLQQGSDRLYLTTQDVAVDDQGRPGLMAPPVTNLREDFPLRPDLLSTLQPFNYNLWIGQTQTGSSSGLHHDFHDNLYVLIHGCKRFRLISPKDAEAMATAGDIAQVHSNGRICYQGEVTAADGSSLAASEASVRQQKAEEAVAKAEDAVAKGLPGAQEQLTEAEAELEEALEALLDAEGGFGDDGDDNDDNDDDDGDNIVLDVLATATSDTPKDVEESLPNSFSKVDLGQPSAVIQKEFPLFQTAVQTFCTVRAGEMLYLPCGWFHEVTSLPQASQANANASKPGLHMAFNYWFHPPVPGDNTCFEQPYPTSAWADDWQLRPESQAFSN